MTVFNNSNPPDGQRRDFIHDRPRGWSKTQGLKYLWPHAFLKNLRRCFGPNAFSPVFLTEFSSRLPLGLLPMHSDDGCHHQPRGHKTKNWHLNNCTVFSGDSELKCDITRIMRFRMHRMYKKTHLKQNLSIILALSFIGAAACTDPSTPEGFCEQLVKMNATFITNAAMQVNAYREKPIRIA
jgi:hypothetical protein